MLYPFWTFPLCLSLSGCPSTVGGIGGRFMSQGEYLSVTDQPALLRWQVSPSPPRWLSSPAWINSLCLAKWGLETHLLPERPSNNWGLGGDPYLKLCGGLAHSSDWLQVLYLQFRGSRGASAPKKGAHSKQKKKGSEVGDLYVLCTEIVWYTPSLAVCWALDITAQSSSVSEHIMDLSNIQRQSRVTPGAH